MNSNDEQKMQFILSIRSKGEADNNVLKALETVNREQFLKGLFAQRAYEDTPLPIECGQNHKPTSIVGLMTQALRITDRDKIFGNWNRIRLSNGRIEQTCSQNLFS